MMSYDKQSAIQEDMKKAILLVCEQHGLSNNGNIKMRQDENGFSCSLVFETTSETDPSIIGCFVQF